MENELHALMDRLWLMTACMAAVAASFLICSRGLQKDIEKITKVMMTASLALIAGLCDICAAGHSSDSVYPGLRGAFLSRLIREG